MFVRLYLLQKLLQNDCSDISKQQALDADLKAIQQINLTANLDRAGNTKIYRILEEAKETLLDLSQGTVSFVNVL